MTAPVLGLLVNPVAGMGGRVGLHGTDDRALPRARALGATPIAPDRARRAVERLQEAVPRLRVLTGSGEMGARTLAGTAAAAWDVSVVPVREGETDASDTRLVLEQMLASGVGLVLFVGGDGTARDVAGSVGTTVPVLGVPAGVKMHSGVFGTTPEAAGATAARYLADPDRVTTRRAEVVDRDLGGDLRLFATVLVPAVPSGIQHPKGASTAASHDASALGREIADQMQPDRLYLLGPGTTVSSVAEALGLSTSSLGVSAVLDGRLLARDADERGLLHLVATHPRVTLLLGVVGGQGFLLGRGNQQLSPAVLRAVGPESIEVLATAAKVAELAEPVLHIDIDDPDLSARLVGYRKVRTGRGRSTVLKVVA